MTKIEQLLDEYGASHQNSTNKKVHWICVPAILMSLVGLLWCVPVPAFFEDIRIGPAQLNWAFIVIIFSMIYYFMLSISLALGMVIVIIILASVGFLLSTFIPLPLWGTCLIIFTLAWIGQFWGHKIEGKKPAFLKDLQFLLVGPIWLLSFVYSKMGIPLTINDVQSQ